MKSNFLLLVSIFLILISSLGLSSDMPKQISYQGRITDTLGEPITQNGLSVRSLIYPVSTGGSFVWVEKSEK